MIIAVFVALVAAVVATTLFPVVYTIKAPWWRKPIGRALFFAHSALALAIDLTLVNVLVDYPGQVVVEIVVFWLITIAALNHLRLLLFPPNEKKETPR